MRLEENTTKSACHARVTRRSDSLFSNVLATRDLASCMQLQALPTLHADVGTAVQNLLALFIWTGMPLVLKADNGSPFIAEHFRQLLDDGRLGRHFTVVVRLYAPYNSSVEPDMGSPKTGTFYNAVQNGHGSDWTSDDLDAAREQANHTLRSWGFSGPTPLERWESRPRITIEQQQEFR